MWIVVTLSELTVLTYDHMPRLTEELFILALCNLVFVWRDGNEESMARAEGARFLSKQFEFREDPGTKLSPMDAWTYRTSPKISKGHIHTHLHRPHLSQLSCWDTIRMEFGRSMVSVSAFYAQ